MGTFRQRIEVATAREGPFVPVDAVVETGATYTLLPRRIVAELGAESEEHEEFILADGRRVTRDVGVVYVRLDGKIRETVYVVGDEADEPLLGAYTLEGFGLAADPVNKQLVPAPKYLL